MACRARKGDWLGFFTVICRWSQTEVSCVWFESTWAFLSTCPYVGSWERGTDKSEKLSAARYKKMESDSLSHKGILMYNLPRPHLTTPQILITENLVKS